MSDSDKELKIKITTIADTSGIKQAASAVREVSETANKIAPLAGRNAPQEFQELPVKDGQEIANAMDGEFPQMETTLQAALIRLAAAARLLFVATGATNEKLLESTMRTAAENDSTGTSQTVASKLLNPQAQSGDAAYASLSSTALVAPPANPATDALQQGEKINQEQNLLLNSLGSLLQAVQISQQDLLALINAARQRQEIFDREIAELKRSLANLASSRQSSQPTPPP